MRRPIRNAVLGSMATARPPWRPRVMELRASGLGLGLAVGLATAALVPTGCVDRLIREPGVCGDGQIDPGEICLGLGDHFSLDIVGITGVALRVADFDGDTHLDLLVVGTDPSGATRARLWRGFGDGRFAGAIDPGIGGCTTLAIAGDIDGDDARDLLVDECGPSVTVFRGSTSGTFIDATVVGTGLVTRSTGMVDLDDDGNREIVLLGEHEASGSYGISVSERVGTQYAAPILSLLGHPDEGFDPRSLGLVDVDRDERFDALLIQPAEVGGLRLAHGLDGLRFGPPVPIGPSGIVPAGAITRDLDEDGFNDVLIFSFEEEALVFLRSESGTLVERTRTEVPALNTGPAAAGDIDADDHLDLLLFQPGTRLLQAWFGRGDGAFDGPEVVGIDAPVGQIALADLDEDGAPDIVVGTFEAGTLQILMTDP